MFVQASNLRDRAIVADYSFWLYSQQSFMSPTRAIVRLCLFRDTHTEADGQKLDDSVYIDGIPWRGGWGCNQEEHCKADHMTTWDCLCCYRGSRCYFNCLWRLQMHQCNCGGGAVSVLLLLALTPAALLLAGSGDCLLGTDKNHVSQRVWNDFGEWSWLIARSNSTTHNAVP